MSQEAACPVAMITGTDRFKPDVRVDYSVFKLSEPHIWVSTDLGSEDSQKPMSCLSDGHHTKLEHRDEVYTHNLCTYEGYHISYFTSLEACVEFVKVNMQRQNLEVTYA